MGIVVRLFPRAWRARYGDEFLALLEDQPPGTRRWADILRCLAVAHLDRSPGDPSNEPARNRFVTLGIAVVGLVAVVLVGAFIAAASPSALRKALDLLPTLTILVPAAASLVFARLMTKAGQRRVRDAVPGALVDVALITIFGVILASMWTPRLGLFELSSTIELRPFQEVLAAPTEAVRNEALAVLAGNAALFTVMGWVLALRYADLGIRRAATAALVIAIGLEIGQVLLGTGRPGDITEVIVRVAGAALGYTLWRTTVRLDSRTNATTVA
jgi:VanZ like family.